MSFAPAYLIVQLFIRIAEFFRHWYMDGGRWFLGRFVLFSNAVGRIFGVRLPGARFVDVSGVAIPFLQLGFFMRTLSVTFGTFVLAFGVICGVFIFVLWTTLPLATLVFAARGIEPSIVFAALRSIL